MAQKGVPVSIAIRHKLLYNHPAPPEELSRIGDQHKEQGLWHDALEFYRVARADDRLEVIASNAVREADIVLYLNAFKGLGREPERGQLDELKASALRLGKESVARRIDMLLFSKGKE